MITTLNQVLFLGSLFEKISRRKFGDCNQRRGRQPVGKSSIVCAKNSSAWSAGEG